jgi:hypothetical integral membrane protein (TIGR02206 family)
VSDFRPFGLTHLLAVLVVLSAIVLGTSWGRRRPHARAPRAFGVVLVVYYLLECLFRVWVLGVPAVLMWPFELCSILFFIGAFAYWADDDRAFEIVFFWTFTGPLHALVTPTPGADFPSPEFFRYFATHGLLIFSAVFAILTRQRVPTFRSVARAFLALQAFELVVGGIDALSGQNFLYLRQPPPSPTLFDALGRWPWYLGSLEAVAALSFLFWFGVAKWVLEHPVRRAR